LATVLLAGAVVGVAWFSGPGPDEVAALDAAPLVSSTTTTRPAPTTTTSTTAPTTTTAPLLPGVLLPVPALLPTDEYAPTPQVTVGTIEIPRIGVAESVQQGMTLTALNRGPSHWPGTALPGELGNVVIGGHRTTYTKPFRDLDQLQLGDDVFFTTPAGRFGYRVTTVEVVGPEQLEIVDQAVSYTATLFACHPPGSAAYRIVVKLQLVDGAGQAVPAPAFRILNPVEVLRFRS
jgi:sortase A